MIQNIVNNPFRVLGVYTNAGIKEITAHSGKIAAFANVGKTTNFPTDDITPKLLSEISRNQQGVANASAAISLPTDKIKHALFWFINTSSIDDVALNHIKNENYEKAFEIFEKKKCYSSLLNCGVLALIQEDLDTAIENITELIHENKYREDFARTICGDTFKIDADTLSKLFIDELLNYIEASELLDAYKSCGKSSDDDDYLESIVIGKPIALINSEIAKAKNCRDNADANYRAGCALINNTKSALEQLNELCSTDNMQYQTVVDNLARQILQCGINYFNESNDDNAIDNALQLQGYALSIAVSKLLKDRCQENVDTLKQMKKHSTIEGDLAFVANKLKNIQAQDYPSIYAAQQLVNECIPKLQNIKKALGKNDELYIQISSAIAHNALGVLIDIVNAQKSKSNIKDAQKVIEIIKTLDVDTQCRTRINNNEQTLNRLLGQIPSFFGEYAEFIVIILIIIIGAIVTQCN
ncbi:MAG: hypothetical protein R3Y59_03395 [bacterium]